jgi:hypothetical protein
MTKAIHKECGIVLDELLCCDTERNNPAYHFSYYCPKCNKLLTSDEKLEIQLIEEEDGALNVEWVNLNYKDYYHFTENKKRDLNGIDDYIWN